ncbi:UDP-glucose 6-dehydrogenase, partial [Gregarina niphandrodes]
ASGQVVDGRPLKIVCIGAGYVGAPTSCILAKQCPHVEVVVVDLSEERIRGFNEGPLPIFEPGLEELVAEVRGRNLSFSTECGRHIGDADVIFVSVNTPTKKYGVGAGQAADLSAWEAAGRTIAEHASTSKIVVEKSTVPVKTASALRFVLSANSRVGVEFQVLSNPEFLAEGTALRDLLFPDRVLIGGDMDTVQGRAAVDVLATLYRHWVPSDKILTMDTWSSELSKLVANAFLAQRISSINSIAMLCEKTGADITEIARAIGKDSRIGPKFLQPSVGFGGSCFRKDIANMVYLCRCTGLQAVANYWESVLEINELGKNLFKDQIVSLLFTTVRGKKIAVFGFAFKKDTGDVRETPAACVCHGLLEEGAIVNVYDPMVTKENAIREMKEQGYNGTYWHSRLTFTATPDEAVQDADGIAIVTEWDAFKTLDYKKFYHTMRKPAFIFDGRLILDHEQLRQIGFYVKAIGKPNDIGRYDPLPGPVPR